MLDCSYLTQPFRELVDKSGRRMTGGQHFLGSELPRGSEGRHTHLFAMDPLVIPEFSPLTQTDEEAVTIILGVFPFGTTFGELGREHSTRDVLLYAHHPDFPEWDRPPGILGSTLARIVPCGPCYEVSFPTFAEGHRTYKTHTWRDGYVWDRALSSTEKTNLRAAGHEIPTDLKKELFTADHEVNAAVECDCGGPAGHVPNGIWCRK